MAEDMYQELLDQHVKALFRIAALENEIARLESQMLAINAPPKPVQPAIHRAMRFSASGR